MTFDPSTDRSIASLIRELDRWSDAGRRLSLWLRDDDAIAATDALDRLLDLCTEHTIVPLIAVIPMRVEPSLAARLGRNPGAVATAVHGAHHANHAPAGRKAEETAVERGLDVVRAELEVARARLVDVFGPSAGVWYVPPWNRIAPEVARLLPDLGFTRLSTFGTRMIRVEPRLLEIDTDVDLIDWRRGRTGRPPAWVAAELERQIARARADGRSQLGLLAHHLAHDATAWSSLQTIIRATRTHPAVHFATPAELTGVSSPQGAF
jgi:hypothetical protein